MLDNAGILSSCRFPVMTILEFNQSLLDFHPKIARLTKNFGGVFSQCCVVDMVLMPAIDGGYSFTPW